MVITNYPSADLRFAPKNKTQAAGRESDGGEGAEVGKRLLLFPTPPSWFV